MPNLLDGEERDVFSRSSGRRYTIKRVGAVYSCSCPAWRNQSRHPDYRTCKHLGAFRGHGEEAARIAPGDHPLNRPETQQVQPTKGGRAMKHAVSTKVVLQKPPAPPKPTQWDKLTGDDDPFDES
jgi:DNA ligase-1